MTKRHKLYAVQYSDARWRMRPPKGTNTQTELELIIEDSIDDEDDDDESCDSFDTEAEAAEAIKQQRLAARSLEVT